MKRYEVHYDYEYSFEELIGVDDQGNSVFEDRYKQDSKILLVSAESASQAVDVAEAVITEEDFVIWSVEELV